MLAKGNTSEDPKYVTDDFQEMLEQLELDLQASQEKLDKSSDKSDNNTSPAE